MPWLANLNVDEGDNVEGTEEVELEEENLENSADLQENLGEEDLENETNLESTEEVNPPENP